MSIKEMVPTLLPLPDIRCLDSEAAPEYIKWRQNGHRVFNLATLDKVNFAGRVLVHNAPAVYLPPLAHAGSEALYLIDYYQEDNRILVSYLPPFSPTSFHRHQEPITEYYYLLAGELYLSDGERCFSPQGYIVIPQEPHFAFTLTQPALALIVMQNARLVPESEQHIPFPTTCQTVSGVRQIPEDTRQAPPCRS